ncbi:MAG: hypothetical protein RIT27_1634 [Pseudomonadota bacterium]|jgi:hypothetical protein
MNALSLLHKTVEKLDFNSPDKKLNNSLKIALQLVDQQIKQPHTVNLLHQTFSKLNENQANLNQPPHFLETALHYLNRGVLGIQPSEEILLDDLVDEPLPDLPDLGEDVLAVETMSGLFVSAKSEYKEPRSFVLEKPAIEIETEPAVITSSPAKPITNNAPQTTAVSPRKELVTTAPVVNIDKARNFFANLPYEKALPRLKVVEEETGEETHFRVLPKQQVWQIENNQTNNPLVAATLQAIQASGGKIADNLNNIDYNTTKSRTFFSTLPWQ